MRIPRATTVALAVALFALSACTLGERGSRHPRPYDPTENGGGPLACRPDARPPERKPDPDRIEGTPSIRVVWEALAVEQEQFRNPKRAPLGSTAFGQPDLEVALINTSFVPTPEQAREIKTERKTGGLARVPDRDMLDFLREIEKSGFFDYAKPTDGVRPYFASDRARGRITVERDGDSRTIVSQYGLGLAPETRAIPGIYAAVKQAIYRLKNRTPSFGVQGATVDKVDPERVKRGEPPLPK